MCRASGERVEVEWKWTSASCMLSQARSSAREPAPPRNDHDQGNRCGRDPFCNGARRCSCGRGQPRGPRTSQNAGHGRTVYALDLGGVTPISTATNQPGRAIRVGVEPVAIAITPNSKTVYVVNSGGVTGSVTPIATATNRPGRPIGVGVMPEAIASRRTG